MAKNNELTTHQQHILRAMVEWTHKDYLFAGLNRTAQSEWFGTRDGGGISPKSIESMATKGVVEFDDRHFFFKLTAAGLAEYRRLFPVASQPAIEPTASGSADSVVTTAERMSDLDASMFLATMNEIYDDGKSVEIWYMNGDHRTDHRNYKSIMAAVKILNWTVDHADSTHYFRPRQKSDIAAARNPLAESSEPVAGGDVVLTDDEHSILVDMKPGANYEFSKLMVSVGIWGPTAKAIIGLMDKGLISEGGEPHWKLYKLTDAGIARQNFVNDQYAKDITADPTPDSVGNGNADDGATNFFMFEPVQTRKEIELTKDISRLQAENRDLVALADMWRGKATEAQRERDETYRLLHDIDQTAPGRLASSELGIDLCQSIQGVRDYIERQNTTPAVASTPADQSADDRLTADEADLLTDVEIIGQPLHHYSAKAQKCFWVMGSRELVRISTNYVMITSAGLIALAAHRQQQAGQTASGEPTAADEAAAYTAHKAADNGKLFSGDDVLAALKPAAITIEVAALLAFIETFEPTTEDIKAHGHNPLLLIDMEDYGLVEHGEESGAWFISTFGEETLAAHRANRNTKR